MKSIVAAFASGVLFAVGLAIAGMTQPAKVISFLDFTGDWDPSLAFVIGGAILVYFIGFRVVTKRKMPLFATRFELPSRRDIDLPLVGGAALFGAGWGLAGYCPGPGFTAAGTGSLAGIVFMVAMLGGMVLYSARELLRNRLARPERLRTAPSTTESVLAADR